MKKHYMAMFEATTKMNSCAKEKDLLRNHTNYGTSTAYASVLRDYGHKVDICVYGDGDYLMSAKIIVDEKVKINFED